MMENILLKRSDSDVVEIEQCIDLLEKVKAKHGVPYSVIETSSLNIRDEEDLLDEIRRVAINGVSVKTGGKGPLPIARNRNSFGKIAVFLQREDGRIRCVYPHVQNQKRYEILPYLEGLLEVDDISEVVSDNSITEEDIARMISTFPDLLEEGLVFSDTEVTVDGGRIDAVFRTADGKHLVIEIEIVAKDNAIGQVQRFKIPYSEKFDVPLEDIRLGIVCGRISDSRLTACKGAGIEVYTLALDRQA